MQIEYWERALCRTVLVWVICETTNISSVLLFLNLGANIFRYLSPDIWLTSFGQQNVNQTPKTWKPTRTVRWWVYPLLHPDATCKFSFALIKIVFDKKCLHRYDMGFCVYSALASCCKMHDECVEYISVFLNTRIHYSQEFALCYVLWLFGDSRFHNIPWEWSN